MKLRKDVQHGTWDYPFQIHLTSLRDGLRLYPHEHEEIEITCITKGQGFFYIDHREYYVREGNILVIPAHSIHLAKPSRKEPAAFCSLVFSPNCLCLSSRSLLYSKYISPIIKQDIFFPQYLDGLELWHKEIYAVIKEMESYAGKEDMELLEQSALLKIWYLLYQNCVMEKYAADRNSTRLKSCLDYLHNHYADEISIHYLASRVNMSEGHFSRVFKEYMKVSPMEFLIQIRMEESKKLLRESEKSIGEIALECGFHDFSYFSKCFRDKTHLSPKEYRKINQ